MGKKLKLNLKDLKVQSFVTKLKKDEKNKIKGGDTPTKPEICTHYCTTGLPTCDTEEICFSDYINCNTQEVCS